MEVCGCKKGRNSHFVSKRTSGFLQYYLRIETVSDGSKPRGKDIDVRDQVQSAKKVSVCVSTPTCDQTYLIKSDFC
jgi:hypothetical protein